MPVRPVELVGWEVIVPPLQVIPGIDPGLPHRTLRCRVRRGRLAFLYAERFEHAHHHFVVLLNRLGAYDGVHVLEMPLVVEWQCRIALVDGIDELLLRRIGCLREVVHL